METTVGGCFRPDGLHALPCVGGTAAVGKEDALEAGADGPLGREVARLLVNFDHGAEVENLGCAAQMIQVVKIERGVLGDKLNIVVDAGMADNLNDGRPGAVDVRAERRLPGVQQRA